MINLVRGELTKLQRGAMVALITIDVHNRDIIEYLIEDGTDNKFDFNWQMRIRYYWDDSLFAPLGDCKIRQVWFIRRFLPKTTTVALYLFVK